MLVFVYEAVSSGELSPGNTPSQLLREGALMLGAVVSDFARLPGVRVVTTIHQNAAKLFANLPAEIVQIRDLPQDFAQHSQRHAFETQLSRCQAAMVIAPETNGVLADRLKTARKLAPRVLNCGQSAVALGSDKLALASELGRWSFPNPPTVSLDAWASRPWGSLPEFPSSATRAYVVKRRDGAGSHAMFLVRSAADWRAAVAHYQQHNSTTSGIVQPYFPGESYSIGILVNDHGPEFLPLARQVLSSDGRFRYLSSQVPSGLSARAEAACLQLAKQLLCQLTETRGYIGIDFLVPADPSLPPMIVDLNCRLCSSYLVYRQLARAANGQPANLAAVMLGTEVANGLHFC